MSLNLYNTTSFCLRRDNQRLETERCRNFREECSHNTWL